jgi:hypothetical protein
LVPLLSVLLVPHIKMPNNMLKFITIKFPVTTCKSTYSLRICYISIIVLQKALIWI